MDRNAGRPEYGCSEQLSSGAARSGVNTDKNRCAPGRQMTAMSHSLGGKDSLVVLHLALSVEPNVPVVFFDSGAEFPETYEFVQQIAQEWKLNFQVYAAKPSLLEILASDGGWQHGSRAGDHSPSAPLQDALIAEPSRRAHTDTRSRRDVGCAR